MNPPFFINCKSMLKNLLSLSKYVELQIKHFFYYCQEKIAISIYELIDKFWNRKNLNELT